LLKQFGNFLGAIATSVFDAYKQASDTTKTAQDHLRGKCLYITQNEALYLDGEYKESRRYFEPRGVKAWFRVKKRYFLKPDNISLVICYEGHTDTIDLANPPEEVHVRRRKRNSPQEGVTLSEEELEQLTEEDLKELGASVEGIDFEDFYMKGAQELSDATMELNDNILLKFIKTYPNWQVILIAIIGMLVGVFLGMVLAVCLGLIFVWLVL